MPTAPFKHYLVVSDFDQTLSFNDSGQILSELLGITDFRQKVDGLASSNLVQQGAELAYLIRHDPAFRGVRREHLAEAGRLVRLRTDIPALVEFLKRGLEGFQFAFFVISAAPHEVIQAALKGTVPADHIIGTEFEYDSDSGEVQSIRRVPAGYGKVAAVEELEARFGISPDTTIYVGDGSSDVHVMMHVNRLGGLTIAVSENKYITPIARRTILSEDALSVLVPMLEEIAEWDSTRIRALFDAHGFVLQDWQKVRTDSLTIRESAAAPPLAN